MHIRAAGLPAPEREYRFTRERRWRVDFAYPARRLLIEIEGATWANGRHNRGYGYEDDCEKYNEATLLGWKVIRFTGDMVEQGKALATIERALKDEQSGDQAGEAERG